MSIKTVLEAEIPDVPVKRPSYCGNAEQYITYHLLGDTGTIYAESKEAELGVLHSVDIWSKSDYVSLLKRVKNALQQAHFAVKVLAEDYDVTTGYSHVILEAAHVGDCYG